MIDDFGSKFEVHNILDLGGQLLVDLKTANATVGFMVAGLISGRVKCC